MGRWRFVVALVAAVSVVLQGFVPANAVSPVAAPFVASDYLSGLAQARLRDHRVLITSELSEESTTWVNPDGTLTTDSFGSPVRVRDVNGLYGWRDLDFRLKFDSAGFVVAESGLLPLTISGGGSKAQVAVTGLVSATNASGQVFGFGWDGALPKPVLEGNVARFVDVLPGVDLLVRLDATGFEQFFEVKSKPSQVVLDALRLGVRGRNVSVVANDSTGFDFVVAGSSVASLVAPSVYDSSNTGLQVAEVAAIEPTVSGSVLDLNVSASFFDNAELVYPVIVDPAVSLDPTFDTYVSSAALTTDFQSSTELLVGTPDSGASKYRSFLTFDSSQWNHQDIVSASLKLYLNWSWSCTAKQFTVYPAATASGATRWGSQPTTYLNDYQSTVAAAGYNSSCAAKYVTANVTTPVSFLAPTIANRAGLAIRASETDSTGWKRFNSDNAASNKPVLTVTYNRYPGTPTAAVVEGAALNGSVTMVSSTKPKLSSSAIDPDRSNVTLTFGSYASVSSTVPIAILCSVTVASGAVGSCVPTTALVADQSYVVKVMASDSRVDSLATSPATSFAVNTSLPATPTIQCPYSNNHVSTTVPSSDFTCTVTTTANAANPVKQVVVVLDDAAPVTFQAAADGSSTNTITLKAGALQHNLTATAISLTGLKSATNTFTATFGTLGVVTPLNATSVSGTLKLSAFAQPNGISTPFLASVSWRRLAATGSWTEAQGSVALTSRAGVQGLYDYVWDVSNLSGLSHSTPETIQVKVCFLYQPSYISSCTGDTAITATIVPASASNGPSATAGPGRVSLLTGALTLSDTDFTESIGDDTLSVSRTAITAPGVGGLGDGIFGPGWFGNAGSNNTAVSRFNMDVSGDYYRIVHLYPTGGDPLTYLRIGTGLYTPVDQTTKGSQVSVTDTSSGLMVTESDGSQTTFSSQDTGWLVSCSRAGLTGKQIQTQFDATGHVTAIGYAPSNSSCANTQPIIQGAKFIYETKDYGTRLVTVTFTGFNPATNSTVTKTVAQYSYNQAGQLVTVTDPRNSQTVSYVYDSANRIIKTGVNGFVPYLFKYDTAGRLTQVQREQYFLFLPANTVDSTFVYNTATTGTSVNYPNLTSTITNHWGQTVAPTYAAAVFDNQHALSLDANNNPQTPALGDQGWRFARFYFTNSTGDVTNTAVYGKTKWLYTANLYTNNQADTRVVYASFDAQGIENVLARFDLEQNNNIDETLYATKQTFATKIRGIEVTDGMYPEAMWGPIHTVTATDGSVSQARTHTTFTYDEGGPDTTKVYGLVTTENVYSETLTGQASLLSKTVTSYDPIDNVSNTGNTSGWVLNQATKVSQYDANNVLVAQSQTLYNSLGQVIKTIQPGSNGNDGRTELTTYYTAEAQTVHPECGNHAEWERLTCVIEYPVAALIPNIYVQSYDWLLNPLVTVEKTASTITRTTTNTYLDDGRLNSEKVEATGLQTFITTNVYDTVTLQQTGTQLTIDGVTTSQTSRTFDAFGRQTSYTNTLGETETTSYIPEGQLAAGAVFASSNPSGTTSYTYGGTDPRAVITGLTFQNSGTTPFTYTYQATYDELGKQTSQQTTVNGNTITQNIEYTDANQIESMSYSQTGSNGNAFLYNWTRSYDKFGRVIKETEPDSNPNATTSKQNIYNYDPAGRLLSNTTTSYAGCNLNSYSYDNAGNRLTKTEGTCTTQTSQSHSYNSFSQLTNTGYSYDALGRNTLIPSIDTPNGNGAITLAYNTNDQVTQISQAGTTTNFTYEAEGRRLNETSNGQTTIRHYTDSSDNPAWTTQTGANGKTEIYSPSLGTGLKVTTTIQNGTQTGSMQLHDLRGNTVTTIDLTTNTTSAWSSYDEYGNPQTTNPANTNNINYSTYGQAERATNTTGLILMGARVYNPTTNQFTSPDPVKGGNENSYTYPNDPMNKSDYFGAKGHSSSGSDIGGIDDVFRILALIQSNVGKSILQGVTKDIEKLKPVVEMFLDRGKPGTTIKVVPGAPGEIHIKSYGRNGVVKKTVRVGVKGENYKIPGAHILNFQSGRKKGPNDAHVQTSFPSGDVKSLFSYLDEEENGAIYGTH